MAKRSGTRPGAEKGTMDPAAADGMEQRVLAFASQLGWMAGTIQTKAEGWMDREKLNEQLASVRDGAARLLQQLADSRKKATAAKPGSKPARQATSGRSGGVVDAPGKKRRPQAPSDPERQVARSQAAKLRLAMPMEKTSRRRARG